MWPARMAVDSPPASRRPATGASGRATPIEDGQCPLVAPQGRIDERPGQQIALGVAAAEFVRVIPHVQQFARRLRIPRGAIVAQRVPQGQAHSFGHGPLGDGRRCRRAGMRERRAGAQCGQHRVHVVEGVEPVRVLHRLPGRVKLPESVADIHAEQLEPPEDGRSIAPLVSMSSNWKSAA